MQTVLPRRRSAVGALALLLVLGAASLGDAQQGEKREKAARILGVDPERDSRSLTDRKQVEYAKALGQEVVCLCGTCPRHTVTNCDCGWAHYNQKTIQLALLDGKTKEQIISAYEQAYGLKVYPEPPNNPLGNLSFTLPYVAAVLGLLAVVLFGLKMRGQGAPAGAVPAGPPPAVDPEVEAARKALERELEDLD